MFLRYHDVYTWKSCTLEILLIGTFGFSIISKSINVEAEGTFVDRNNRTHFLEGYQVHEDFMSTVKDVFEENMKAPLTYFDQYYKGKDNFFAAIDKMNYCFLQFFYSLYKNDTAFYNFFLRLFNTTAREEFKNWLLTEIDLPSEHVYEVIGRLAKDKSEESNAIPRIILNELLKMNGKYKYFQTACERGNSDIVLWTLRSGLRLDELGLQALTAAWLGGHWDVVKILIQESSFPYKFLTTDYATRQSGANETLLHFAADVGATDIADSLLEAGANIDAVDAFGKTPLQRAIENHQNIIARKFIDVGADLNHETQFSDSLLHIAGYVGNYVAANLLLKEGFLLDRKNAAGLTSFDIVERLGVMTISNKAFTKCEYINDEYSEDTTNLLEFRKEFKFGKVCHVDQFKGFANSSILFRNLTMFIQILGKKGGQSRTNVETKCKLLSFAVENKMAEAIDFILEIKVSMSCISFAVYTSILRNDALSVEKLLVAGANFSTFNSQGLKPIHVAAINGRLKPLQALLAHGDNVNSAALLDGKTVVYLAAQNGHTDVVRTLIDHGANINIPDDEGLKPIHAAASNGNAEVVKMLLQYGADPNSVGGFNITPLYVAASHGHENVARILLNAGADVRYRQRENKTALYAAVFGGNVGVLTLLLNRGADINAIDRTNRSALFYASEWGLLDMVEVLIERGADVNANGNYGMTPLMFAAIGRKDTVVRALLRHGANVNAKDYKSRTSLYWAAHIGSKEIVETLLEYGADANIQSIDGVTPLEAARRRNFYAVIQLLEKHPKKR